MKNQTGTFGIPRFSGWLFAFSLAFAPLALGCRPLALMESLARLLLVSTFLWACEVRFLLHRPFHISKYLLSAVLLLVLFICVGFFNPSSSFLAATRTLLPSPDIIAFLPSVADTTNAFPTALLTTGLLLALIPLTDLCRFPRWRMIFLWTMSLTGGLFLFVGVLQKLGPLRSLRVWIVNQPWSSGVPFATFEYHNNAGTFINILIPTLLLTFLCLARFYPSSFQTRAKQYGFLFLFLLAMAYVAAVFNIARIALVLTTIFTIPILYILWNTCCTYYSAFATHKKRIGILVVMLLCGASAAAFFISPAVTRMADAPEQLSEPWNPRYLQAQTAWHTFLKSPVYGFGPGGWRLLVQQSEIKTHFFAPKYFPGNSFTVLSNVNNDYLQTLVEWGIVGTLLWALLLLPPMIFLFTRLRTSEWKYALLILIALAAVFLHAFVDCPLQHPAIQLYVIFYIALIYAQMNSSTKPKISFANQ